MGRWIASHPTSGDTPKLVRNISIEAPVTSSPASSSPSICSTFSPTMSSSRAIICTGKGEAAVKEVPIPSVREGYILVKTKALGLNPTDWKSIHSGDAGGKKIGVRID